MNSNKKNGPISEINVTPLVDVMLVLLIIFMVSAPLMFSGVKLKLPKTKKVNSLNLDNEKLILSLTKDSKIFLGKRELSINQLEIEAINFFNKNPEEILYIRADAELMYGEVAKIMAFLKKIGVINMALVTEPSVK